ncbi:hypothetical protein P3T76_003020 [Phytophthora citrophthora]|uniref:Fe2OG dioxygenase domain-containing protein n=1 Tax=Phytophthora citrophthora TaxID=4793 RepID=A0AAD9GWJ1_9STRA|nr:hypothetical protein P3T76_003020 [Phytophthora citrophthora]
MACILYKLLVYEEGGHFVKHQDTKKEEGMIATLVIQSPSLHEGGDLVVYGGGEIKHRHDFGKADGTATYLPHYAVHYADAEHALETVTKGYRLALVYSAFKGIDRARFCALEEANAALPDGEKLRFVIAKLYHHVSFYGSSGSIGDWDEESRDEKITCYTTKGVYVSAGATLPVKLNFLNPEQETRAQRWMKPYGSSDMHGYLGNEGPSKDSQYNRYAIVAWSKEGQVENMLKIMDLKDALAALQSAGALDRQTFREFVEAASVKLAQVAEVMAKRPRAEWRSYRKTYAVPRKLRFAVCNLLETFGSLALVNFQAVFKIYCSIATILKMFPWSEVGDSLLDALSSESDEDSISSTEGIAQKLENGPAKRGLLKYAVVKVLSVDDEELSRSYDIETLWKLVS